jgi:hypothetical protein
MFHEFDQDGGGSLSRDEFEKALREKLGALFVVCCLLFVVCFAVLYPGWANH